MTATASFTLSKEMREKLADQLTCQAVAKHAKKIGATLKKVNAEFWDDHLALVDAVLKIDRSRHTELIQLGIIAATSSILPANPKGHCLLRFEKQHREEAQFEVVKLVLRSQAYQDAGISDAIKMTSSRYSEFCLNLRSPYGSVPRLNGMDQFEEVHYVTRQVVKVRAELTSIFSAAFEFKTKAADILNSCRTSRQLIEIFPEAAKLLPQPVKRTNELAPVELVNDVRSMLQTGVPVSVK